MLDASKTLDIKTTLSNGYDGKAKPMPRDREDCIIFHEAIWLMRMIDLIGRKADSWFQHPKKTQIESLGQPEREKEVGTLGYFRVHPIYS
jgi:hypothetical protein